MVRGASLSPHPHADHDAVSVSRIVLLRAMKIVGAKNFVPTAERA